MRTIQAGAEFDFVTLSEPIIRDRQDLAGRFLFLLLGFYYVRIKA